MRSLGAQGVPCGSMGRGKRGKGGGEKKSFGSFAELAGKTAPSEKEERGWTLETDADEAGPDVEALEERGGGVRERISARPEAHGEMDTGPGCYRDSRSDEMELLASFRIRTRFPEDVVKEAALLAADPIESEWGERVDLRERVVFTLPSMTLLARQSPMRIVPLTFRLVQGAGGGWRQPLRVRRRGVPTGRH